VERNIGRTWVRVDGRVELTLVVFGDPEMPPLLGAYTLEGLRLAADPVSRRLIPVPGLLLTTVIMGARLAPWPPETSSLRGRRESRSPLPEQFL
jgi:hypothetical protein